MHKCWQIPELAGRIVGECLRNHETLTESTDKEGLKTLNALARTCHALLEPSLDIMWYRQDTLSHLIKCLPRDLWDFGGRSSEQVIVARPGGGWQLAASSNELRLTNARSLQPKDWERFDFYACRIRVIHSSFFEGEGPPHRSWDMLDTLRRLKNAPLLPNLQNAILGSHVPIACDAIEFLERIAPPTLTEMSLTLRDINRSRSGVDLPALAASCPALERATIALDPRLNPSVLDFTPLTTAVAFWRGLRNLVVEVMPCTGPEPAVIMDHRLLEALAALPVLDDLKLDMWTRSDAPWFAGGETSAKGPHVLHNLRRLAISARATRTVQMLLESISTPSLQKVKISTSDTAGMVGIPPLIQSSPFATRLQKLDLTSYPGSLLDGERGIVPASTLYPLTLLSDLQELAVNVGYRAAAQTFETSDADWEVLAPSWPHLRRLSVVDGCREATRPTLKTLVLLAHHCRNLESVVISLRESEHAATQTSERVDPDTDVRVVEHTADNEALPTHRSLTYLDLRFTTIAEPRIDDAARSLAKLFPRLSSVQRMVESPPDPRYVGSPPVFEEAPWEELMQLIATYQ